MDYIHLGRSGLSVGRLCLGTMNFGSLTPPAEAEAIMDRAHEIGINDARRAVTLGLDDDVLNRLDDLFPGYRPAPEHYAW
jgi:hypothetical protein